MTMRHAIILPGGTATQQLELAELAERTGWDGVFVWEAAYGVDAWGLLSAMAARTTRVTLGTMLTPLPWRRPWKVASQVATLDQLSGGRMVLGLGSSGPQVSEGWHGVRFAHQLQRTREDVAVVRMALERRRVAFDGETLTLPLPDGPGKALKLTIAPVQERLPIYLGATGPRNVALAGEIADGWLPILMPPEHLDALSAPLREGAQRAGRTLDDFDVAPVVPVRVDADAGAARDAVRPFLALYVGGMGSRERNFYNELVARYGFADAAREVQDLYLAGRQRDAAAALPAALIDQVALVGPPDHVRDRLARFAAAGVGTLSVMPFARDAAARLEQVRTVARLAEAAR